MKRMSLVMKRLKHNIMSSVIWEINALYKPKTTQNQPDQNT